VTTELILLSRVAFRDREITGPRLRGLLALLARDLRWGCSTARLMAGLWPDEQPENPAKALQILVSRARAQLGSDVIVRTPTGYRLSLQEDQVDSSAVLLSESATAKHSRAGDHAAALAQAEAGLALWDGATGGDAGLDDPFEHAIRRSARGVAHHEERPAIQHDPRLVRDAVGASLGHPARGGWRALRPPLRGGGHHEPERGQVVVGGVAVDAVPPGVGLHGDPRAGADPFPRRVAALPLAHSVTSRLHAGGCYERTMLAASHGRR
jgi:hypothetical protein